VAESHQGAPKEPTLGGGERMPETPHCMRHEAYDPQCGVCQLYEMLARLERDRSTHGSGHISRDLRKLSRKGKRRVEDVPGL